ncbi:TetR family transcriptional regulator [Gluconacetobacter sp. 1b LMG 1731]|uniref:TetR family transcriptional regulator n=1 Tax=Gluconacetobacter dulcium TaxID=2729096 RepID=A0A7W4INN4_9PROT|nr:TetR family transcriptional regulator [Gluconacetobacter dulcium]MBB2166084.1 TetR family transcriptional regulator [Gluconacetobacter dulcium]MBB2195220.1 TetR family transcriptional regulator [Gluconacetobacter dulcium]
MAGLSLRSVAQDVGVSLGALSYHVGDKASLLAAIVALQRDEWQDIRTRWASRTARLPLSDADTLSAVIEAFLDDTATARRPFAIAGCELLLDAVHNPDALPSLASVLDDEDDFWTTLFQTGDVGHATMLGPVVAAYCRDEMPYTVALGDDTQYRLLRRANIARLAQGFSGTAHGLSRALPNLVALCGEESAETPLPVALHTGTRQMELARHIADLIAEYGIPAISHRLVAKRSDIAVSSVAYHFRTRDDLLLAGLGALVLDMRQELHDRDGGQESRRGMAVMRATHAIALAATRDPSLRPFALDMRRRRSENVRDEVSLQIGGPRGLDPAAIQAACMATIGSGLARLAAGAAPRRLEVTFDLLRTLRLARMA